MPKLPESNHDRRDHISRLALELFLERGYSRTSMNAVAQVANVQKPSLYHHFGSKEDMFVAALTVEAAAPLAAVEALLADGHGTPDDRFRIVLGLMHDAMVGSSMGRMATVIADTARRFPSVAEGFHARYIFPMESALSRSYGPCVAAGTHRDVPVATVGQIVFGPLLNVAMSEVIFENAPHLLDGWLTGRSRDDFVAMIDSVLRS